MNRELISTKSELLLTKRMYNAGFETYKELQVENEKLGERLQVELRASNVLAHEKYPKTDYFGKP